jgi:short-subunit dehydrogenase
MSIRKKSILITGASSGIGRALAREYAATGVHIALGGRNQERLETIAAECRAMGATVTKGCVDIRDRTRLSDWIRSVDDANPIDIAIANAGITAGIGENREREHPDLVRQVIATNLIGTINTIDPLVERMCRRGRGHIAVMGSVAAVRGLPYCPAYCASKAALHAYAEGLRSVLSRQNVNVTIIAPGFVATAMTKNIVSPKPLMMSDVRAARIIRRGLERNKTVIVFPRMLYYALMLTGFLPKRWTDIAFSAVQVDVPEKFEPALD